MTHKYPLQLEPTVEIGFCDKPAAIVEIFFDQVLSYCEEGHFIKGKGYGSKEKAIEIGERLERWINLRK